MTEKAGKMTDEKGQVDKGEDERAGRGLLVCLAWRGGLILA